MTGIGSLLWMVLIGLVFFFMMRKGGGCCGGHDHDSHTSAPHDEKVAGSSIDPVCGMEVDPSSNVPQSEHNGHTVYFCSPRCKEQFDHDPGSFQRKTDREQPARSGCCG